VHQADGEIVIRRVPEVDARAGGGGDKRNGLGATDGDGCSATSGVDGLVAIVTSGNHERHTRKLGKVVKRAFLDRRAVVRPVV